MYYIYAILSEINNYIYVGLTANIDERFKRHNSGRERTTKSYRPFRLLFLSDIGERKTARKVEIYLKSGVGKEFLRTLI